MISGLGHVAVQVPDLEASVRYATRVLGLLEVERTADASFLALPSHLTYPTSHHSLQYIQGAEGALDHIGLAAPDQVAIERLRERLDAARVDVIADLPREPGIEAAIRFAGPAGHVFEVFAGMSDAVRPAASGGVTPRRLGHVNIKVGDSLAPTLRFLTEVLGFKVSDYVDGAAPVAAFLRCNALHHSIALILGPPGLHHYAFEVASAQDLVSFGDALDRAGGRFIWGPGRHGAGDNIATYHLDPGNAVVEHYTDMQLITSDEWEARRWSADDYRTTNTWGPLPDAGMTDHGVTLVDRGYASR
jgi:catechol 2,3-dioxygenase-like lactoylglutathione lyase family enzyme